VPHSSFRKGKDRSAPLHHCAPRCVPSVLCVLPCLMLLAAAGCVGVRDRTVGNGLQSKASRPLNTHTQRKQHTKERT
jgi:hypothetical protein